jgi:hypothetical protein
MPQTSTISKQEPNRVEWDDELSRVMSESDFRLLADYIGGVEYGSVTIQIQDGKAIQIEKHEKVRIRRNRPDDETK